MRLHSLTTISLLVVLTSLATVAAVPPLRRTVCCELAPVSLVHSFVPEAERQRDNAQAWLAVLSGHARHWTSPDDLDRARERLTTLTPDSAAPYLLAGVGDVPLSRSEIDAYTGTTAGAKEEPLTDDQRERAAELLAGLDRAAGLDPTNAAIDYLRAYLYLANHRDEDAIKSLRKAVAKPHWNLYQRDAAVAAYRIASPRQHPRVARLVFTASAFDPQTKMIYLCRVLAGMSVLAERRGDYARASFLRESVIHLAYLMMAYPDTISDALLGVIAWAVVIDTPLSDRFPAGRGATKTDKDAGMQAALLATRCMPMVAYLRKHGRKDLADEVLTVSKAADDMQSRIGDHTARSMANWGKDSTVWRLAAVEEGGRAAAATLALLLVAALAALMLRALHRPLAPVRFSRFAWVLVVCFALVVAVCVRFLFPPEHPNELDPLSGEMYALLGLPLTMLLVLAIVIRQRLRVGRGSVGPVAQYVATLIAVLLPLAALLSLGMLGLGVAAASDWHSQTVANQRIVEQGEVRYYGLELR